MAYAKSSSIDKLACYLLLADPNNLHLVAHAQVDWRHCLSSLTA